jgi:uncharacterized membrane protein
MITLVFGLTIFLGMHLFPSFVALRNKAITHLGEGPYKGIFSVISLTGIVLIVIGMSRADYLPIWEPPVWNRNLVLPLMVLSFILLAAANAPSNIKRFTRHPMLWGVTLWSAAHLLANGDLASILLFGAFAAFSLFDMFSANLRGATKQQEKLPVKKDVIAIIVGLVMYAVFVFLHPYLFGVAII